MSSTSVVHVIARHWAKPGHVEEVRRLLHRLIEPTRAEPGCLTYTLCESLDDPTEFTFVESFASDAALAVHAAAPYIAGLATALAGLTSRPSEVRRYRPSVR